MKDMRLLIWLTQLGLSTAVPLAGFVLLGIWLYRSRGWGVWVLIAGIAIGLICAFDGLRTSLRSMERMARNDEKKPFAGFNDHE